MGYTLQGLYFAFMVYTIIYCSKVKCSLQGLYSKGFLSVFQQIKQTQKVYILCPI